MQRWAVIATFATVTLGLWPSRSEACSCGLGVIYASEPEDGAEDVPINQAVVLRGLITTRIA